MIEILTDENFEEKVPGCPGTAGPWLISCADRRGPCKIMGPILEPIAEEYQDKLIVAKLNVDQSSQRPRWPIRCARFRTWAILPERRAEQQHPRRGVKGKRSEQASCVCRAVTEKQG